MNKPMQPGGENGAWGRSTFTLGAMAGGLLAGLCIYFVGDTWLDANKNFPLAIAAAQFIAIAFGGVILLATPGALLRSIVAAVLVALFVSAPTYYMVGLSAGEQSLTEFPVIFWISLGHPIACYVLLAFAKAIIDDGFPPRYHPLFLNGLTFPLIIVGAGLFAGLAFTLLLAWGVLLKSLNVPAFTETFSKPWFFFPFLGAIGGLSIAMMRGMETVLNALRFLLLLFSRIAMPIMAVFSVTLVIVIAINGPGPLFERAYSGGILLGLSFAGMLIFNGVYQNGEGAPPPVWLRLSTLAVLASFPIYTGLAAFAFWMRVGEYGLTPPRVFGLVMNALAFAYSLVCLAGLLSELNWRSKRWMPLVAPLNTMMGALWAIILIGLATPIINPWAISAKSQERLLVEGRIKADDFDYGYLAFELGEAGQKALQRLEGLDEHPEAAAIKAGVDQARTASSYYEYRRNQADRTRERDGIFSADPE